MKKPYLCFEESVLLQESILMAKTKSGMTTVGAMRAALQEKGDGAANADLLAWIKSTYPGVKIQEKYMSQLKNAARKGLKKRRKKAKASAAAPTTVASVSAVDANAITVADIAAVKALVERVGAKKTMQLAGVLG
jgi:hypothetical protein